MNAKHLLDAMNDIDYSMVEEAENMMNRQKSRIPRRKKTVLIAAAVAVLLCITVAATVGILGMTPELHVNDEEYVLYLRDQYITLPQSSMQTILTSPSRTPENPSFEYTFASVEEWQHFYGIPLVLSSYLSPYGTVGSAVSVVEKDDEIRLGMMFSSVKVGYHRERNGISEKVWIGDVEVMALVNDDEEIKLGGFSRRVKDGENAEILKEFTTDAGIPCVISKIKPTGDDSPVSLHLYYGYESVIYGFEVFALSEEEEAIRIDQLMTIADTLQIIPVPEDQPSSAE